MQAHPEFIDIQERMCRMNQQTVDKVLRDLAGRDPDFFMECDADFSVDLQKLMCEPGLMLLSGPPEMGCTALALSIALCLTKHHRKTVLYFTSDSTREAMIRRLLCMEARVDLDALWDRFLDDAGWERICTAADTLKSIPLEIYDDPLLTTEEIAQICEKHDPVGLVVIDRLQMAACFREEENRILAQLSTVAEQKQIPILCLNMIRGGDGKVPDMWDIRGLRPSFDRLDKVLFLHREDYFDPAAEPGKATCYVQMNRKGRGTKQIELQWLPECKVFL